MDEKNALNMQPTYLTKFDKDLLRVCVLQSMQMLAADREKYAGNKGIVEALDMGIRVRNDILAELI